MGDRRTASRLLVTGGAGFIGANFVRYWSGRHPRARIVVLDALTYAGNLDNLEGLDRLPGFRFVAGDIRDRPLVEGLLEEEEIDVVVHFAAESHVDRSIRRPDPVIDVNIRGTHSLLEAARSVWLSTANGARGRLFHHISTDEVFGSLGPDDPPFSESAAYAPSSPYAASKAAADHLVRAYHKTYGLPATISNCSNNYGPYQFPEKLIPLCIVNLLEGRPLPVYGDGLNVRDWLHVEDHCRGIDLILARGRVGRTYNIGGGSQRTNLELITDLCRLVDELFARRPELGRRFPDCPAASGAGSESSIRFVDDRPGHDRRYAIDTTLAAAELGYRARIPLAAGLRSTLLWYLDNATWWRSVASGSARRRSGAHQRDSDGS